MQKLQRLFENYFPEQMQYPAWVRQPFSYDTTKADINNLNLQMFWCQQIESYPLIAKVSLEVLMPFITTYESMHILVDFKAKKRNRLPCENDRELLFPRQSLKFYN